VNIHVDGDGVLADTVAHCLTERGDTVTRGDRDERSCDLIWACHTTKVDASGKPDADRVEEAIAKSSLGWTGPMFISSCLPGGMMKKLEARLHSQLVYIPENIRYASAIKDFKNQERTVVGTRHFEVFDISPLIDRVIGPFTKCIIRTDPETAEMSKLAMNGLLALSVVYANEIARLCRCSGANAVTVMETIMAEPRVGPGLPLRPGDPYGNAHLGREVFNLNQLARNYEIEIDLPVISNIDRSNRS
jgi:UDPglucose 6-dehydrogenase